MIFLFFETNQYLCINELRKVKISQKETFLNLQSFLADTNYTIPNYCLYKNIKLNHDYVTFVELKFEN